MPDVKDREQDQQPQSPLIDQEGDRERRIDAMRPKDESCGCGSNVAEDEKDSERES